MYELRRSGDVSERFIKTEMVLFGEYTGAWSDNIHQGSTEDGTRREGTRAEPDTSTVVVGDTGLI